MDFDWHGAPITRSTMRIEPDDLSRPAIHALLNEHLPSVAVGPNAMNAKHITNSHSQRHASAPKSTA